MNVREEKVDSNGRGENAVEGLLKYSRSRFYEFLWQPEPCSTVAASNPRSATAQGFTLTLLDRTWYLNQLLLSEALYSKENTNYSLKG